MRHGNAVDPCHQFGQGLGLIVERYYDGYVQFIIHGMPLFAQRGVKRFGRTRQHACNDKAENGTEQDAQESYSPQGS